MVLFSFLYYYSQIKTPPIKLLAVQLEIKAPFSTASVTILFEDGRAFYLRKQRGEKDNETRYPRGSFSADEIKTISESIYNNNFFSLIDQPWTEDSPLDGSVYTISVRFIEESRRPSLKHSVSCYQFNCDDRFLRIKKVITDSFGEDILEVGV